MKCKRLFMLCIAIAVLMIIQCVYATKSKAEIKTGTDGDNVTWTFDTETGVLTFSGTGPITDDADVTDDIMDKVTKKIIIGEGITDIKDRAYLFCYAIEDIEVDENNPVYSSEDGCLYNKDKTVLLYWPCGRTGSYTIPSSVTKIADYAFFVAKKLTDVTIPSSVTEIGEYAFYKCESLKKITIPDSVTSIKEGAFSKCIKLENVELSENITSIKERLFEDCYNLKYVELSNKVESIGAWAFTAFPEISIDGVENQDTEDEVMDACPMVLVIPNSVTSISNNSIGRIDNDLEAVKSTIYCKSDSTIKQYIDDWNNGNYRQGLLEYIIDDDAPTINSVIQEGNSIVIDATDGEGAGIKKKGYSLDGENWVESNSFDVSESGTYTVYVRDKLYNISSKEITIDIIDNDQDDIGDKEANKTEDSQADTALPNTGSKFPFILIAVLAIAGMAYKRYNKYNFKM